VTYQIHRYPADLIDVVTLPGTGRVVIRPVLPQDLDLTARFFRDLSQSARYDRFLSPARQLPDDLLRRFTEIDYADHCALVGEVFSGGAESVVAEARYIRATDEPSAEFAVAVAEPWQGKGLASRMLSALVCRAGASGIARITGQTLATNERMLHLARKAGFVVRHSPDTRGLMLLERDVAPAPPGKICNCNAQSAAAA
jgi:acetyltransferase